MDSSAIELRIDPRERPVGSTTVRRLLPFRSRRMVGPFTFADLIGREELDDATSPSVDAHPHIGLATVTYLYEGSIFHRDSLGSEQEISPGDINWMTAGRGIVHSERSSEAARATERTVHGLQMWVALPRECEEMEPAFVHTPKSALPELSGEGWQGRLIAGSLYGKTSPVATLSRLFFADIRADAGTSLLFAPDYEEAAVYVVEGELDIDGATVEAGTLAVLDARPEVTLTTMKETVFAVFGGDALPEPRHMYWNFVSTSRERIEQAKNDWRARRFDPVPGDDDYVPLPE